MSRSPFLTVLALGLGALPYLLTAFIGGVLADRVDRARLLASIYCAKALVYALIWEMWARIACPCPSVSLGVVYSPRTTP